MPISPATVNKLNPGSELTWMIGQRFGFSKDIVLSPELTKLAFLSDKFTITHVLGTNVAFSLGDTFIALGVILLLWMLGGKSKLKTKEIINDPHSTSINQKIDKNHDFDLKTHKFYQACFSPFG